MTEDLLQVTLVVQERWKVLRKIGRRWRVWGEIHEAMDMVALKLESPKQATSSSPPGSDPQGDAGAVNGDTSDRPSVSNCFQTRTGDRTPWLEVDLLYVYTFKSMKLIQRYICKMGTYGVYPDGCKACTTSCKYLCSNFYGCQSQAEKSLKNVYVSVSNSSDDVTTADPPSGQKCGLVRSVPTRGNVSVSCSPPKVGRYVHLTKHDTSGLPPCVEQLASATQSQHHAEEMLAVEKERAALMEKDWDQLKEARDLAEKRAQQGQDRLHQEQDSWYQREQELVHKIDQVKEANLKVMQMERVKLEEQTRKVEEMEERVHTAGTEVKRLEMDLDSAIREKESLKVEMALMEAKFESAQRSLQADLQATMEKEMTEQVSRVQGQMRQEQEQQAERHRQLVGELHQRHQRDLEAQIAALRQDLAHREELLARELADMESRVNEYRQENSALKQAKQKLESQR
ncbi:uncharacterized protein LOC143287832 [Babylonia areolata]|uniref:uncharacterized protein LOC143287832 n=1 Tax=Babylonia areolata TaxID=304850 RepID=UPI003FD44C66